MIVPESSMHGLIRRAKICAFVAAFTILLAMAPWLVFAATLTFKTALGGAPNGSNWSDPNIWTGNVAPVTGDDVLWEGGNTARIFNYDLAATIQLRSITLNSAQGNVTLTGGPIVLQSGGFITNNFSNSGNEDFPGVTLNGPTTFTNTAGTSALRFTGAVTGTGPLTLSNTGLADGLQLTVASTYTGATTISGTSRVQANVNGAVPTGSALTVNGSALFMTSSTIGSLAGGGNVFMNGDNTLDVGGDNTSTTFSGVYQNSGGAAALTKTGTGTLTLSGFNTYTGATTVNAGTLAINNHVLSPVTVKNGGTLAGNGTMDNTVTVNSGGTLSPGNSTARIFTGDLTLNGGSMLTAELNGLNAGIDYDQVVLTGTVTLGGGELDVLLGFTPTVGNVFTIIDNDRTDPVVGSFMLLGEGATFCVGGTQFRISYAGGVDGNDVTLTVIAADQITCPASITTGTGPGATQCCATVTFPDPTTAGTCGTVSCSPTSGSCFPVGTTTVTCTTTAGPSCSFTVTVADTTPPTITCPANVTAVAAQTCPISSSATVTFPPPTISDNCPGVTSVCTPPSGSVLPVGTTTVTCTATDASGNTATCSFTVTVFSGCLQDDSNPANVVLFNAATGEYRFCCNGTVFTGVGTLIVKGCVVTIQHYPADRRVLIKFDGGVSAGTASLQSPPGSIRCTITDRNTKNNTCVCQ